MSPSWRYIRNATPSAYATRMPMKMRVRLVNRAPTLSSFAATRGGTAGLGSGPAAGRTRSTRAQARSRHSGRQILGERVAAAAQGADRIEQRGDRLHLGAQRLDVGVDGAVHAVAVAAPDAVEQRLAREDVAGARRERPEETELVARELERATVVAHLHAP